MENNTQAYNRYSYVANNPLLPPFGAGGYTDPTGYRLPPPTYETYDPNDGTRGGGGMGGNGGNSIGYQGNLDLLLGNVPYSYNYMGSYSLYANNPNMYGMLFGTNTWSEIMTDALKEKRSKEAALKRFLTQKSENGVYTNNPDEVNRIVGMFNRGNSISDIVDLYNDIGFTIYASNGQFTVDLNSFWNTWNAIQTDLNNLDGIDLHNTSQILRKTAGYANIFAQPLSQAWTRASKYGTPLNTTLVWFEKSIGKTKVIHTPAIEMSTKTVRQLGTALKSTRYIAGGLGIGVGIYDMIVNGVTLSNSLDVVMSGLALTGFGSGIATGYFLLNAGLQTFTGQDIGQHIGNIINKINERP